MDEFFSISKFDKILVCFGTRPEYIKVKSILENLSENVRTCFTGQHKDLLKNIRVDYELNMDENISDNRLNNIICNILKHNNIFNDIDYVLVQGDTTTALAIALSAFNNGVKIIHLEAGLRSNNLNDPYPEEANRQIISRIASIHLCPTNFNKSNLMKENTFGEIYVIGNTGLDNIDKNLCEYGNNVLITMHRRDNHDVMDKWFTEIEKIANKYRDIEFLIPLHPNPAVQKHRNIFERVKVIEPMTHEQLIEYIKKCKYVISDSGGLQEECSYLNKKIIVCRKTTERPESVGIHSFICESPDKLQLIADEINRNFVVDATCPYGNGMSWNNIKIKKNGCLIFSGGEGSSSIINYLSQQIDVFGFEFFEEQNFKNFNENTIPELLESLYSKNKSLFFKKVIEYGYVYDLENILFPEKEFFFKIRFNYTNENVFNILKKYDVKIFRIIRNDLLKRAISLYDEQLQFEPKQIIEPKIYCVDKIKDLLAFLREEQRYMFYFLSYYSKYNIEVITYEDFLLSKKIFLTNILNKLNIFYNNIDLKNCFFKKVHDDNLKKFVLNYNELIQLNN